MQDLHDLLAKRMPNEPPEIRLIKDFTQEQYQELVGVTVRDREIILSVRSAALAGTLRMRIPELRRLCGDTDKRFVFRIV